MQNIYLEKDLEDIVGKFVKLLVQSVIVLEKVIWIY